MNSIEAIQALAEGKRVRATTWPKENYACVGADGFPVFVAADGAEYHRGEWSGMPIRSDLVWEIYPEANPHPIGTFAWARREAIENKRTVARASLPQLIHAAEDFRPSQAWTLSSIDATDWMHK